MKSCKEALFCLPALLVLTVLLCGAVSQERAKQVRCANNLKQILRVMHNYVNDHGVMPPVWTPQKPLWTFWADNIDPDFATRTFAACPSDVRNSHMYKEKPDPLVPQLRRIASFSYGMNERMHTRSRRATMNDFANPEKLIIFGDAKIPTLQPVQNPGVKRHMNRFHYITAAGNIRLYSEKTLGGKNNNGHFNVKETLWSPWR